jgi:hypothetical protein
MGRWVDEQPDERVDESTDEQPDEQRDMWTYDYVHGWMNGLMTVLFHRRSTPVGSALHKSATARPLIPPVARTTPPPKLSNLER